MKNNWTIITALVLSLSASLIIPKVADARGKLDYLLISSNSSRNNIELNQSKDNSQTDGNDTYIPPNYGAPDSQHGSGTR